MRRTIVFTGGGPSAVVALFNAQRKAEERERQLSERIFALIDENAELKRRLAEMASEASSDEVNRFSEDV